MTLKELAAMVAEQVTAKALGGITTARTYFILKAFLKNIEVALSEGEVVRLEHFGSFKSERVTGSGMLPGRPRSRKYSVYFKPYQDLRARVRSERIHPKNPYGPVLRSDIMAWAKLTGKCPTCKETMPAAQPLRCPTCGPVNRRIPD